jgi:hypothetical protein
LIKDIRGQAVAELGIFGLIIIFLLAFLISYGLGHNLQQRLSQFAFRKALADNVHAPDDGYPLSVSHIMIRDRHIPDPGNIFGRGTVQSFSASGSVTWNYMAGLSGENDSELPVTKVSIGGLINESENVQEIELKSAGFKEYSNVSEDDLPEYYKIFGQTNVFAKGKDGSWVSINDTDNIAKICTDSDVTIGECMSYAYDQIRVMDSCLGDTYDYASCTNQCRDADENGGVVKLDYCGSLVDTDLIAKSFQKGSQENSALGVVTGPAGVITKEFTNWKEATTRTLQPQRGGSRSVATEVGESGVESRATPWK